MCTSSPELHPTLQFPHNPGTSTSKSSMDHELPLSHLHKETADAPATVTESMVCLQSITLGPLILDKITRLSWTPTLQTWLQDLSKGAIQKFNQLFCNFFTSRHQQQTRVAIIHLHDVELRLPVAFFSQFPSI